MHEVSIMHETLRLAQERATVAGASRILEVRLRVGRLSGVVPDSLRFAFETLREGTMAADAHLAIDDVAAICWCASCQVEFAAADLLCECPQCHAISAELRRGRELELVSMEIH
jgi:hydrogenase nickel incorporation protein HypA/HybF